MAVIGNTEIGNTKQELIAKIVQKELAFKAYLTNLITDVSVSAQAGAKQISFPKLTSFTVSSRTEGSAGVPQTITSSLDSLLLDQNAYVSWIIDAFTAKQSNIEAQLESAKRASSAMARFVDNKIIAEIRSVCTHFQNVGADVDATYANMINMMLRLEEANGEVAQSAWIVSPKQKSVLLTLDEFKRADVYGQSSIPSGMIGEILGAKVFVHSGLAQKELFLVEKSGVAIGFQKNAEYGEESDIDYGVGAKKCAVDMYFGVKGQQLTAGKSALVFGLND